MPKEVFNFKFTKGLEKKQILEESKGQYFKIP